MGKTPVQVVLGYTLAILAVGIPAMVFLILGLTRMARRDAPSIPAIERGAAFMATGAILMLATFTLFVAQQSTQVGVAFGLLSVAYVLYCLPKATRRMAYRCAVTVRCSPEEAFALVSDARNWPRYEPGAKVLEPVDVPPHVGSVIHVTLTMPTVTLSADEEVTECEPPRRFTTTLLGAGGEGIYDFTRATYGTEIAYTYRNVVGIRHALLGHAVLRFSTVGTMRRRKEQVMQVMKQILEAPPAVPV